MWKPRRFSSFSSHSWHCGDVFVKQLNASSYFVKGFFFFLFWAFYFCFPLFACFGVPLKVASFCKSALTIIANVCFYQFDDVFDQKCMTFVNSDCHSVFQLVRRVPSEIPMDFPIFLPLGLVRSDPESLLEGPPFIQIPLHLVKFTKAGYWNIIRLKEASR